MTPYLTVYFVFQTQSIHDTQMSDLDNTGTLNDQEEDEYNNKENEEGMCAQSSVHEENETNVNSKEEPFDDYGQDSFETKINDDEMSFSAVIESLGEDSKKTLMQFSESFSQIEEYERDVCNAVSNLQVHANALNETLLKQKSELYANLKSITKSLKREV